MSLSALRRRPCAAQGRSLALVLLAAATTLAVAACSPVLPCPETPLVFTHQPSDYYGPGTFFLSCPTDGRTIRCHHYHRHWICGKDGHPLLGPQPGVRCPPGMRLPVAARDAARLPCRFSKPGRTGFLTDRNVEGPGGIIPFMRRRGRSTGTGTQLALARTVTASCSSTGRPLTRRVSWMPFSPSGRTPPLMPLSPGLTLRSLSGALAMS